MRDAHTRTDAPLQSAVRNTARRGAVFVSERVGNYQHHPLFGVLLDQLWVR